MLAILPNHTLIQQRLGFWGFGVLVEFSYFPISPFPYPLSPIPYSLFPD
jgi:hypothetical protein